MELSSCRYLRTVLSSRRFRSMSTLRCKQQAAGEFMLPAVGHLLGWQGYTPNVVLLALGVQSPSFSKKDFKGITK